MSDLIMYQFAEQSARLRAKQVGGSKELLYKALVPWINARAVEAFQILSGESVTLPAVEPTDYDTISDLVYQKKAPL